MSESRSLHALTDRLLAATAVDARRRVPRGATVAAWAGAAVTGGPAAVDAAVLTGCAATTAPSSSTIVTTPVRLPIVAPAGFESTTLNCSVASAVVLLTTVTANVISVTPTANVKVAVRVW